MRRRRWFDPLHSFSSFGFLCLVHKSQYSGLECGGAIKVASLAGAIFRHKDCKRGQQDTLCYFWDHESGLNICFPDTPDAHQIVRAQTRKDDASGASRRDKHAQIVHMKDVQDKNVERDVTRQKRVDKTQEAIASIAAIASVEALEAAYLIAPRADRSLSVAALDLQLDWDLANPVPGLPGSEETSASGIPKAKTGPKGRGTRETQFEYLKQAISSTDTPAADPSAAVEEPVPLEVSSMDVDDGA